MIDQPTREATGLALLEQRSAAGLTQLELAHRTGMSQTVVARLELGQQACTLEQLALLAKALRVTRVALFAHIERARKVLQHPNARALFLAGRKRVRAPKLRV